VDEKGEQAEEAEQVSNHGGGGACLRREGSAGGEGGKEGGGDAGRGIQIEAEVLITFSRRYSSERYSCASAPLGLRQG
jgi:hypothetical protein